MKVSILKISNFFKVDINKIKQCISEEKRRRIDRFYKKEDVIRGIYSELLIRKMIIEQLKISNRDIKFKVNEYGKPYLKGRENIHFNVSHSGEYVVCCLDDKPTGIDIEMIKPIKIKGIAENCFTVTERDYILGKNASTTLEERINKFYEIWTIKESFVKCIGKGLYTPLNEFCVLLGKNGEIKIDTKETNNKFFLKQITIDKRYKMSICSQGNIITKEFNYITQEQLINEFY